MKWICLVLLLFGCQKSDQKFHKYNLHGEYLYRTHSDRLFSPSPALPRSKEKYAWENLFVGKYPRITKEFFRCKGNSLHPPLYRGEKKNLYRDCAGGDHHGLPLREEKEFVYPCLIDLLNYIQEKTEKRVVITSGHRCPQHNSYCDEAKSNWSSKHMIGAEVDFYVEGLEEQPQQIVDLIQQFYQEAFKGQKEHETFKRYQKENLTISTLPWYNKEVFIKLFSKTEGRNIDNHHPYPYLSIQVRYDRELEKQVTFDPKQAQNYLRY